MGWFYLAIGVYVALEIGMAAWMVEFLQKTRGQSVAASTMALSLLFLMVTVGRLLGSFLVDRVGLLRSILLASLAATALVVREEASSLPGGAGELARAPERE